VLQLVRKKLMVLPHRPHNGHQCPLEIEARLPSNGLADVIVAELARKQAPSPGMGTTAPSCSQPKPLRSAYLGIVVKNAPQHGERVLGKHRNTLILHTPPPACAHTHTHLHRQRKAAGCCCQPPHSRTSLVPILASPAE
jgi:hypothetical protein